MSESAVSAAAPWSWPVVSIVRTATQTSPAAMAAATPEAESSIAITPAGPSPSRRIASR